MSGRHAALEALRDEWLAEPAGSALLHSQAAVRLMHLLDEHPPADLPVATGDAGTEGDPVLIDAVRYYAERRTMNNPKGWDHVHRKVSQAAAAGAYGDRPTGPALATIAALAEAERATSAAGSSPEDAGETPAHPKFEAFKERHLENPGIRAAYESIKAQRDAEDAGERVGLSDAERESIRAAMGDVAGHPFVTVVAEVERILAGRLAAVEQERDEIEQEAAALREQVVAVGLVVERWIARGVPVRGGGDGDEALFELQGALADPASVLAQRDAEVGAKALAAHRLEWADYISNWSAAVGASPPTVESIIEALRQPSPPFGRARGPRQGVDRG